MPLHVRSAECERTAIHEKLGPRGGQSASRQAAARQVYEWFCGKVDCIAVAAWVSDREEYNYRTPLIQAQLSRPPSSAHGIPPFAAQSVVSVPCQIRSVGGTGGTNAYRAKLP